MALKVAVITGANKGVGNGIVETLLKSLDLKTWKVYLTARDEERGNAAVKEFNAKGLFPCFHQLDICSKQSIEKLKSYLLEKYSGLDILVNNAGIAYKTAATEPFAEQAEVSVKTNYLATLDVCRILFPILRPHARVANVSSLVAQSVKSKMTPEHRKIFTSPMTMDELTGHMEKFVKCAKDGKVEEMGYVKTAYGWSKVAVTVMSHILQEELKNDPREDIAVNSCCPGYVATDMSSFKGTKTILEGADTPCYLALLPENTDIKGEYVSERTVYKW